MSTTIGNSVGLVFCEGKTDARFLNKYFKESPNLLVVEAGGKRAIPSFVKGYIQGRPNNYIALRDRDLDFTPPASDQLIGTNKTYLFATYRASIENYWFDAQPMLQYLEWLNQSPNYRTRGWILPQADTLTQLIVEASKSIRHYAAARWALADIKRELGRTELNDKWLETSGELPSDLSSASCLQEGRRWLQDFQTNLSAADAALFQSKFEVYAEKFAPEEFYQSGSFLIWFHGKDLLTAFNKALASDTELRRWNFSFDKYCEAFCEVTNTELRFDISPYPDLIDLKNRINALA